ncbi:MAG: hypothetical protein JWO99_280 [Candidatus Saccharibacteria bacterium]|nr:hypothetical protein [Candidatus Saccharibacteria bacterium]
MSPENGTPQPASREFVHTMDYVRLAEVSENPRNVEVVYQELLRRSASPDVKADPLFQHVWDIVALHRRELLQDS